MVKHTQAPYLKINDWIILIYQASMKSMNFNTCNTYLLRIDKKEYAIIDPGCSKRKLSITLKKNEIDISSIKYAFLTHAHSDHMNLLEYIRNKNENLEVFIHEADKRFVESAKDYYNMLFNFDLISNNPKYKDFIDTVRYYTTSGSTFQIKPNFKMVFDIWNVKDRKIDNTFREGDVLPGGLEVIHVPGHTPGMCFFHDGENGILFSSDIHLSRIGANMNGNYADVSIFKESISRLLDMIEVGEVDIILSGHGTNPIKENLKEKVQDFLNSITLQEEKILSVLETSDTLTLEELTEITFKDYIKRFDKYLDQYKDFMDTIVIAEASELLSNLNYLKELERLNKVRRVYIDNKEKWTSIN